MRGKAQEEEEENIVYHAALIACFSVLSWFLDEDIPSDDITTLHRLNSESLQANFLKCQHILLLFLPADICLSFSNKDFLTSIAAKVACLICSSILAFLFRFLFLFWIQSFRVFWRLKKYNWKFTNFSSLWGKTLIFQ